MKKEDIDKLKEIKDAQTELNEALNKLDKGTASKQLMEEMMQKNEKLLRLLKEYNHTT